MSMFFTSQLENDRQTVETSLFFSTLIFYSEIRFENLISAHEAKSRLKMRDLDL